MLTIHENKEDYTPEEAAILQQEYDKLTIKLQSEELTLEEVRVRIAYLRYKREENFKIAIVKEKKPKVVKEPKEKKPRQSRKKKTTTDLEDYLNEFSA